MLVRATGVGIAVVLTFLPRLALVGVVVGRGIQRETAPTGFLDGQRCGLARRGGGWGVCEVSFPNRGISEKIAERSCMGAPACMGLSRTEGMTTSCTRK